MARPATFAMPQRSFARRCRFHLWRSDAGPTISRVARTALATAAGPSRSIGEETVRQTLVDKLVLIGFLVAATSLEATGDAIVRMGIGEDALMRRGLLFLAGGTLLFGYGVSINLAPVEFGRVVGLYIATLFVVWQVVNWIAFRSLPAPPVLAGGLLIIVGGAIVTLWK
jgi:small multidrug resistance family-3 protein